MEKSGTRGAERPSYLIFPTDLVKKTKVSMEDECAGALRF